MIFKTKLAVASIFIAGLFSAGCAQTAEVSNNFATIETEEDVAPIIGKKLSLGDNYLVLDSDNTLEGIWSGETLRGTWEMKNGLWCRLNTEGPDELMNPAAGCQRWETDGVNIKGTRQNSENQSFMLKINGE